MKKSVTFVLLALCIRFILEPYQVSTSDMAPTLLTGDYLWVQKQVYGLNVFKRYWQVWKQPQRGEVVLLEEPQHPHHLMFKRIIGLPGDRVFYSKGVLFINEKMYKPQPPLEVKQEWGFLRPFDFPGENETGGLNNYVHWQEELSAGPYSVLRKKEEDISFGPYKIPKGHYFVMGDHRSQSRDSRTWPIHARIAGGIVTFKKQSKFEKVIIPKGTIVYVDEDPYFPIRFETLTAVVLENSSVSVKVKALEPGLTAHVEKNSKWKIEGLLHSQVKVSNEKEFSGGQDKSLIPLHSIKGRAMVVLWGCETTLPILKFLCQFDSFRKQRWYWPVHKKRRID
ncbi:MAG: signal peptidase I [Bdellovibrionales bacterium]|nr:signal peptidase I [Bdellovibrionales bacterium]